MSAKDISRFLFQPAKHYSGVRMQQGRVILDSDWNESERLDDEDLRRTLVDFLCAKGTSNGGFQVGEVTPVDVEVPTDDVATETVASFDFEVGAGSFLLGGLRFEAEAGESFLAQQDGLQLTADANLPRAPSLQEVSAAERFDLVFLRAWEQCVSAVEDSEIRERALGGPDTSVRVRRMRRIEVLTLPSGVDATCAAAFAELRRQLTLGGHEFDENSCELRSRARLTVIPGDDGAPEDACKPRGARGFLGADNQTIRVQLTQPDRFVWGYDNAAPLYRVRVRRFETPAEGEEGNPNVDELVEVEFLTLPRDQESQPLAGQTVELLPWGSLLPNREKVMAEDAGFFARVEASFDPESGVVRLDRPVPAHMLGWLGLHGEAHSARDEMPEYLYLRLWTGGGEDGEPDHPFSPGESVPLAGTGLEVRFSDPGLSGEYWIVAARPHTPDVVVPWELMSEAPSAGPRQFFASLALVRWFADGDEAGNPLLAAEVRDCRHRFRPLCDVQGCCTYTVGDGVHSRGAFQSLADALAQLPDQGGEICLLPGTHQANVLIEGRRDIVIHGCGKHTRLIPAPGRPLDPLFEIVDSHCITLRDMEMVQFGGTAVLARGTEVGDLTGLTVEGNRILGGGSSENQSDAVRVERGVEVTVRRNRIRVLDRGGSGVGVYLLAEDSVVEANDIGVMPAPPDPGDRPDGPGSLVNPTDPCVDDNSFYLDLSLLGTVVSGIFAFSGATDLTSNPGAEPYLALGGVQVAAASERVRILENRIHGGAGHGVTLGGGPGVVAAEPDDDEEPPILVHSTAPLNVVTVSDGEPVPHVSLSFEPTQAGLPTVAGTTDLSGSFFSPELVSSGTYQVIVNTAGWRAERVEPITSPPGGSVGFNLYNIHLVAEEPTVDEALGFLYEIDIDDNEILGMGLSGIGAPLPSADVDTRSQTLPRFIEVLGHVVFGLGIRRNHIHDCLQAPFGDRLRQLVLSRGQGGVSLGFCQDVQIFDNRIESNGRRHQGPVCGIFIFIGARLEIHRNRIVGNGPTLAGAAALVPGQRGGVVIGQASITFGTPHQTYFDSVPFNDSASANDRTFVDLDQPTVRVHDNVIEQPAGQALRATVGGALSVCDNFLSADFTRPEPQLSEGSVVHLVNNGFQQPTLFRGNQTTARAGNSGFHCQYIETTGDLGFHANQSLYLGRGPSSGVGIVNTWLRAQTLRATGNRLMERPNLPGAFIAYSLQTHSWLMNNTTDNQGDHCISAVNAAAGRAPVTTGNQMLDISNCINVTIWTDLAFGEELLFDVF